jgi:23S rRNA (uracil1939-C5)-methyltransferase
LTKQDADLVVSRSVEHVSGPASFPFQLAGYTFDLDPMAFYQANHSLTDSFIQHIVEGLGGNVLLDLYGGFGSYSFVAKNRFQSIYVVEANTRSIEAAERAAAQAQRTDIHTSSEKVETFLQRFARSSKAQSVTDVIVNPPRAGLSPIVIRALLSPQFPNLRRVHYVSCNPETLKRDLKQLLAGPQAFRLANLTPFDMFPQTDHIECVAKLIKSPQARPAQDAGPKKGPRHTTNKPVLKKIVRRPETKKSQ